MATRSRNTTGRRRATHSSRPSYAARRRTGRCAKTPRDLAALGRFVLDGGCDPDGARLIAAEQLAAVLTPTAANPAYGRLWWLNGGAWAIDAYGVRSDGPVAPAAPPDLVLALGAQGRILGIVPSLRLIAVRMGQQPPDTEFRNAFWRRVMAAIG